MTARLTREQVESQYKSECSFYLYGSCDIRSCLVRGGWTSGPTEGFVPTCAEKEAIEAAALREELEQVKKERDNFKQMIGDVSKGLDPVKVLTEGMAHVIAIKQQLTQAQAENARLREALGQCLEDYMRWRYASPTLIDKAQAALDTREEK